MIRVVKRDGRIEPLDIKKIQKYTADAVAGLKNVSQSELEVDAKLQFRDMISTEDIQQTIIKTAVDKIDIDRPDWTFVASRLFLYDLYHKVSGFTGYQHLREYFERGEREGAILLGLKDKYDLDDLNKYIKPERDLQFTYLGIKTLYDRYLLKDREGRPIELPQHLFMGVAMFLAQNEKNRQYWAKEFYNVISKFEVMVATPTLSNGRTPRHQLSSCFPKGERVLTAKGFKNIEDIEVNDFVVTHKNRLKRVYEVLKREYSGKLYKFNISGFEKDTLKCTEEHPILAVKSGNDKSSADWIEAKDIEVGDLVRVIYNLDDKEDLFLKVEKIETETFRDKVYNLEVEDDHSYVVNNIAVHNCYIGSTPDNIEGIFDAYKEMSLLSKFGGGIGWDWSKVRAMGSSIDGHKHAAGGIIPFLKITNDIAIAVDQLGCVAKDSFVRVLKSNNIEIIPISEVRIGDLVESFNIEKGEVQYRKVEKVHELEVKRENQIKISFKSGGYIITSKWHPMAIKGKNNFYYKRSDEIEIGEFGVNHKGEADEIIAIDTNPNISEEYMDLTVQGTNNYFASTHNRDGNFYLTHNTRKGAIAVYIEPWHIDIRDFLDLKKNSGEERRRAHDLFPALWINDIFMKRVREDSSWTLFDPYQVSHLTELYGEEFEREYKRLEKDDSLTKIVISAKGLWKEILRSYFETGNPFLTFKDTANRTNPNSHKGVIRSSNLCVTGDTRLATQFGLVKAKDLEENYKEIIASFDYRTNGDIEQFGVGKAQALKMFKTAKSADIYEVITKDGYKIKSTLWHKYYISNGKNIEKKSLKEIKIGDKLLIQSDIGQFGEEGNYNYGVLYGLASSPNSYIDKPINQKIPNLNINPLLKVTIDRAIKEVSLSVDIVQNRYIRVPESIFKGKIETVKGYLQTLFTINSFIDEVNNRKTISIIMDNREFLEDIQILLSNFGIRTVIKDNSLLIDESNAYLFTQRIGFIGKDYEFKNLTRENFEVEIKEINYIGKEDVYDTTQLYNHSLIFNGLVTGNCTEIFQNTNPNHYKVKVIYEDRSVDTFEEEEIVRVDSGIEKPAKKITALDSLSGKKIWIVEKEKIDGDTAVCNLASINLSKINREEDIKRVVPIAIRMLDNVIDLNFYPLEKVKNTNHKSRAIGLGVMGEAQMLAESKIKWGSDKHLLKIDEIMEAISYYAIDSSSNLAKEKGKYPLFEGSNWSRGIFPIDMAKKEALDLVKREPCCDWEALREKVKRDGVRNGYLMAIAPTSSISILTGTTQTIEPVYKRKWFEENLSGLIPVVVPNLSPETWEYYTPSYELDQNILVKAGAIRQKWIDQGQSLNIFIRLDRASGRYLNEIYMNAWILGLKSTYYLRSQSPETTNSVADRSQECVGCQ